MKKIIAFILGALATAFLFAYVSPLYAVRGIAVLGGVMITLNHIAALVGGTVAAVKLVK